MAAYFFISGIKRKFFKILTLFRKWYKIKIGIIPNKEQYKGEKRCHI